jgi:hypothetical protein
MSEKLGLLSRETDRGSLFKNGLVIKLWDGSVLGVHYLDERNARYLLKNANCDQGSNCKNRLHVEEINDHSRYLHIMLTVMNIDLPNDL